MYTVLVWWFLKAYKILLSKFRSLSSIIPEIFLIFDEDLKFGNSILYGNRIGSKYLRSSPLNTIWKRVRENLIAQKWRWIGSYPCQSSQVFLLTHQCCVQWNDSRHSPVLLSYITHRLYRPRCHMFYQRIIWRRPSAYNSLVSSWLLGYTAGYFRPIIHYDNKPAFHNLSIIYRIKPLPYNL